MLPCYSCERVCARCGTRRGIAWTEWVNLASCLTITPHAVASASSAHKCGARNVVQVMRCMYRVHVPVDTCYHRDNVMLPCFANARVGACCVTQRIRGRRCLLLLVGEQLSVISIAGTACAAWVWLVSSLGGVLAPELAVPCCVISRRHNWCIPFDGPQRECAGNIARYRGFPAS